MTTESELVQGCCGLVDPGMGADDAEAVAERMRSVVSGPLPVTDVDAEIFVGVSAGIALSDGDGSDPGALIRDADAAIEHFSNISHLMEPLMATASVTGEVLGSPNGKMKEELAKGGPRLFTPWIALQDELVTEK